MSPKIIKGIIYTCLYSILITPLLVWGKFLFPYITPKTFFFRIIIEIALFFYILLIVYKPEYRPRFSKLTWIILVYILIITFASIFGVDFYNSFWGNIERGEGLLTIYHLFIFYILLISIFKEKKDWFRFFNASIFISLILAFYALGQKFQFSFLLQSSGGSRLTGTIGNASFLAAYLLMSAFLCLFLSIYRKKIGWRIFYGLTFLFELYIIFQTETRGALLGFFGGLLLIAFLSVLFSKNKKTKIYFTGLFLLLIIFAGSVWIFQDYSWIKNNNALRRLTEISFSDVTTQTRLLGWQAAGKGWQDRFLFGYGYENYNVAYNKYFPVAIFLDIGSRVWFDRAHNIILDQAVPGGIFGLLSYLSIFGFAVWALFYLLRKKKETGFIILIAFLAAYFAQNFFVFDTLGTYILFYSVLGFISYLLLENQSKEDDQVKASSEPRPFFIIILVLILIFSIYIFNIKPAIANTLSIKGMSYAYGDMYREAMTEFKKSLNYGTYQAPEIRHNLSKTVVMAYQSGQFTKQENIDNFEYAIEEMNKNLEAAPLNARHFAFAMTLYNAAAGFNPDYYNKVVELGYQALKLSPDRPQIYYSMGQARISQGRFEEGIEYFKKAVELSPTVVESHWNLAAAYIIVGKDELAEEEFAIMEELGFDYYSMNNLLRMTKPYLIRRDFNKLASVYEELVKLDPNNPDFYAKLAASYKEIGQIEKAKQAVQKAVELDPSFADEAAAFLKLLGQ